MHLLLVETRDEVIENLMNVISAAAETAIRKKDVFNIGLSGGSLATFLTIGLPTIKSDFTKWKFFFCDERLVPENDADSTFGHYRKHLIDTNKVNLKPEQFVRVKQSVSAQEAADDYSKQIEKHFGVGSICPRFDMLLLGMGPDGHTCSLFPGHKLLVETKKWIAPITDSPKPPPSRITMTFPVINNALNCVFAISGKEKAEMIKKILVDKEDLPSTRVKPTEGSLYWIVDKEAGVHLEK